MYIPLQRLAFCTPSTFVSPQATAPGSLGVQMTFSFLQLPVRLRFSSPFLLGATKVNDMASHSLTERDECDMNQGSFVFCLSIFLFCLRKILKILFIDSLNARRTPIFR